MKFYAYIPTNKGNEPLGTDNRILFEFKTIRRAVNYSNRVLGNGKYRLFTYTNIYNDNTYERIK